MFDPSLVVVVAKINKLIIRFFLCLWCDAGQFFICQLTFSHSSHDIKLAFVLVGISRQFIKHILKPYIIAIIKDKILNQVCLMIDDSRRCRGSVLLRLASCHVRVSSRWAFHEVIQEMPVTCPCHHGHSGCLDIDLTVVIHSKTDSYLISFSYVIRPIFIYGNISRRAIAKRAALDNHTEIRRVFVGRRCLKHADINSVNASNI